MKIGAVVAKPKANLPTSAGEPSLARTIVIANQEAALIVFPTNVHEKLVRKLRPVNTFWTDDFKIFSSHLKRVQNIVPFDKFHPDRRELNRFYAK
jgi:hypothetical protein